MTGSVTELLSPGRTVLLTNVTTISLSTVSSEVSRFLSSLFSTSFVAAASRSLASDNRPCSRNNTATWAVVWSEPCGVENTLSWIPPTAKLCFPGLDISRMAFVMNVLNKRSK